MAATRAIPYAVAVIDAAMRAHVTTLRAELRIAVLVDTVRGGLFEMWDDAVAPYSRHRWVTTVRQALRWADPAAESYLESLSRVAMRQSGLPLPEVGIPLTGDDGITRWVDFWWEKASLIGEADGRAKYVDVAALLDEKLRQEALTGSGRTMVRWGMAQVRPSTAPLLNRLRPYLVSPPRASRWS